MTYIPTYFSTNFPTTLKRPKEQFCQNLMHKFQDLCIGGFSFSFCFTISTILPRIKYDKIRSSSIQDYRCNKFSNLKK